MIIEGLNAGEIISEDTINKLEPELDSVICFLSCAYVDGLIESLRNYIVSLNEKKED